MEYKMGEKRRCEVEVTCVMERALVDIPLIERFVSRT
jgi:hypothetical protein